MGADPVEELLAMNAAVTDHRNFPSACAFLQLPVAREIASWSVCRMRLSLGLLATIIFVNDFRSENGPRAAAWAPKRRVRTGRSPQELIWVKGHAACEVDNSSRVNRENRQMIKRQIVQIDEEKCDGCGQCVPGCEEGAIQIVHGKARLVSDVYCDGLGACLGHCPRGAISLVEREAEEFDEAAVSRHLAASRAALPVLEPMIAAGGGCPGTRARHLRPANGSRRPIAESESDREPETAAPSGLANWPVQLHLVPPTAPYLQNADLLLAADCVPFALADFHRRFLDGRPVLIGCPKLDETGFYVKKLAQIVQTASLRSITVVRLEVPCCMGLTQIARAALEAAQSSCPLREAVVSIQGTVLQSEEIRSLR
jgi:ferredoxin